MNLDTLYNQLRNTTDAKLVAVTPNYILMIDNVNTYTFRKSHGRIVSVTITNVSRETFYRQ